MLFSVFESWFICAHGERGLGRHRVIDDGDKGSAKRGGGGGGRRKKEDERGGGADEGGGGEVDRTGFVGVVVREFPRRDSERRRRQSLRGVERT